jgi:hypothetical protein
MGPPQPLFLIGNKRSGTSHLVDLLNLHPRVFVSPESDIIWILYQAVRGLPFRCYPWDGPVGMERTLQLCAGELGAELAGVAREAVAQRFFRVQGQLMRYASADGGLPPKDGLAWIGDKKPVQHVDPEIRPFLRAHFPHARYIHLVRHPRAVVSSMLSAAASWARVEYWRGDASAVLERWAIHEEWALAAKDEDKLPVFTLRLEDLWEHPVRKMSELFGFLGLEMPPGLPDEIRRRNRGGQNDKYASFVLPEVSRADEIMQRLGYHR